MEVVQCDRRKPRGHSLVGILAKKLRDPFRAHQVKFRLVEEARRPPVPRLRGGASSTPAAALFGGAGKPGAAFLGRRLCASSLERPEFLFRKPSLVEFCHAGQFAQIKQLRNQVGGAGARFGGRYKICNAVAAQFVVRWRRRRGG